MNHHIKTSKKADLHSKMPKKGFLFWMVSESYLLLICFKALGEIQKEKINFLACKTAAQISVSHVHLEIMVGTGTHLYLFVLGVGI